MPDKEPLKQAQSIIRELENHVEDFATWIIEHPDQAKRIERDEFNFTFEFEGDEEAGKPELICKFWVANDARWLHLEINEMQLNIPDDTVRNRLWERLEELAQEYPNYSL